MRTSPSLEWRRRYGRRLIISDAVVLIWVFVTAHVAWAATRTQAALDVIEPYDTAPVVLSVLLAGVWLLVLALAGTREPVVLGAGPEEYKRVVTSTAIWFAFIAFVGYMVKFDIPRSYVAVSVVFGAFLLVLSRWAWRQWLLAHRREGTMSNATVVVGTVGGVDHLADVMGLNSAFGYRLVGACVPAGSGLEAVAGIPVVGDLDSVATAVERMRADAVIVASSDETHPDMVRRLGWELESRDVELVVAPSLANIAGPRVHVRPAAGLPLLHVEQPSYRGTSRWVKAIFDRVGATALLLAFSPVFLVVAIAIRAGGRGGVFYTQQRVGQDGEPFGMIKFRSMVPDADRLVTQLTSDGANEVMFKMKDDPRVTRIGRLIRRTSVDELPQLINVIKGDMSLVGPRPPLTSEVSGYEAEAHRRLLVRPGMTGPWQISGRSDLQWDETMRLDLYYVENWSIVGDLLILWKTLRAVVSSEGAY